MSQPTSRSGRLRAGPRSPLRRAAAALVLATATAAATVLGTEPANAAPPRPTIVLVHGAWATVDSWDPVAAALRAQGYQVVVPENPLRGVQWDADVVRHTLQSIRGPVVLVGHSYGGMVITNAATGVPGVKALVYLAAYVPDQGQAGELLSDPIRYPGGVPFDALSPQPITNPASPLGVDANLYLRPDRFHDVFAQDLPTAQTDRLAATQEPLAASANIELSGPPAWRSIPSWYLLTTQDHAIPPAAQHDMATHAGARISTVDSSHAVMLSHPDAAVTLIDAAAQQSGY